MSKMTNGPHLPPHRFWQRDRQDAGVILGALPDEDACRGLEQLGNCSEAAPCENWFCPACRNRASIALRKKGQRWGRSTESRLYISFLTVISSCNYRKKGGELDEVEKSISSTRRSVSKVLNKWPAAHAVGRFEIDYLVKGAVPTAIKSKTLTALGLEPGKKVDLMVPHLHAVVVHPGIPRASIRIQLRRAFPVRYQVKMSALHKNKSQSENITNLARYMFKFELPQSASARKPSDKYIIRYFRMMEHFGGLYGTLEYVHQAR